jgi:soluble lytic murein transglycosylase-like protein
MNPPKNVRGILLLFIALSGLFLACAIVLSARQTESRKTIASLQKTVLSLNEALNTHQAAIAKSDFYRFQENVYRLHAPEFARIADSVFTLSRKHGFNPYLVMALIFVESRFDRRAVSNKGACGLMQVNYPVWKDALNIDRKRLFQVDYNIELGLTILKGYLLETKGDIIRALILYNNGYNYTGNDFHEKVLASRFYRHGDIG